MASSNSPCDQVQIDHASDPLLRDVGSSSPITVWPVQPIRDSSPAIKQSPIRSILESPDALALPGDNTRSPPPADLDLDNTRQNTEPFSDVTAQLYQKSHQMPRAVKDSSASSDQQFDHFLSLHTCDSVDHFRQGITNGLALAMIALSLFSTIFSGIYLVIALTGPKYRMISKHGTLTISTAAFLTSLVAKMIELSFVTVTIAFIGQRLARRAFKDNAPGVTLTEISMRNWIQQPGTIFTQWQPLRYTALTWLGVVVLLSVIGATLYTSAATALVQARLQFSGREQRVLKGSVNTSFANSDYVTSSCRTPITVVQDVGESAETQYECTFIEQAADALYNYFNWIGEWTSLALSGHGTRDLATRLPGWAILNGNTTVTAPWIDQVAPMFHEGWFVNNVTMAMPHPGVAQVNYAMHAPNDVRIH